MYFSNIFGKNIWPSKLFFFHLSEFINCTHFEPIKSIKFKKKKGYFRELERWLAP